jgi:hypothetical protein
MFALRTFSWFGRALFVMLVMRLAAGQSATPEPHLPVLSEAAPSVPGHNSVSFDGLVDSAIRQERRLTELMRNFKPVVETYIQQETADSNLGTFPKQ